ncbi:MAG: CHAP domain-containing protein [Aeromicrobium erythreum]
MRRTHGPTVTVGVVAAVIITMQLLAAVPARAVSLSLCTGLVQCVKLSLPDAGYSAVRSASNWGMDPGTNCTNYVGYRLNSGGRLTARLPGLTTAHSWGIAARKHGVPVSSTPTVGAVAWWAEHVPPADKYGHVAYVEKVYPDGSFDVSEDSFNGDFGWRRVLKKADGWPSGFISFPQSNGSPAGELTSVTSPRKDTLDLWGWGSDPDAFGKPMTVLLSVGGGRTNPKAKKFTTTTTYFRYHRVLRSSRMPSGWKKVHVYLRNTTGTAGSTYTWIGSRSVRIK